MKYFRVLIMVVLLTLVGRALADSFTVESVTMKPGETKQIAISLNNTDCMYAAFQFDLVLPEGVSIAEKGKGKYMASLNEDRKDNHALTVTKRKDGSYRFLSYSISNANFSGDSGPLVYVTLQVAEGAKAGVKTCGLKNQILSEAGGVQHQFPDVSFSVKVQSGKLTTDSADYTDY